MWLFEPARKEWKALKADDTVTQDPLPAWQKAAANDPFAGGRKWRVRRPEEIKWSADRPGAAESYGVCYDPATKAVWFLGGSRYAGSTEGPLGLWRYDPAKNSFQEVKVSGGGPAPTGAVRLACDSERNLLVSAPVFPDNKGAAGTLSPATGAWKPGSGPGGGSHPAMAYDAKAKLTVLFGADGQTWTFDGAAWKEANPAAKPPARTHAGMCYAPEAGGVVLVGGSTCRDTWVYDASGNAWKELPAAGLPSDLKPGAGRAYNCDCLAYDPDSKSVVLYDPLVGVWALPVGKR
jgi:hypothetical protein